jgi:hypothetical protein
LFKPNADLLQFDGNRPENVVIDFRNYGADNDDRCEIEEETTRDTPEDILEFIRGLGNNHRNKIIVIQLSHNNTFQTLATRLVTKKH